MRRTIVSTILSSSLLLTAAAYASPPASDSAAPAHRVSTGITPPRLLDSFNLTTEPSDMNAPRGTQIAISFVVDEKGQPHDIHIVQGYNSLWDQRVLEAVSKLHYIPATLDHQPVPMGMNLIITLNR